MGWAAHRYHDISAGHRVVGHEGKCRWLHGHNYRIHFWLGPAPARQLDDVGRVIDFSVIKSKLCTWLEDWWDHRFLVWENDPHFDALAAIDPNIVRVPFNPTAENIGEYLVKFIGPELLHGLGVVLTEVEVEETRKCSASFKL